MNGEKLQFIRLGKHGNSIAAVIPVAYLTALQWTRGDTCAFAIMPGDILCVRKLTEQEVAALKPLPEIK